MEGPWMECRRCLYSPLAPPHPPLTACSGSSGPAAASATQPAGMRRRSSSGGRVCRQRQAYQEEQVRGDACHRDQPACQTDVPCITHPCFILYPSTHYTSSGGNRLPLLLGGVGLAAALGGSAYWAVAHPAAAPALAAVKHYLASSAIAKSGFFAAFRCLLLVACCRRGCCCLGELITPLGPLPRTDPHRDTFIPPHPPPTHTTQPHLSV